MLTCRWQLLTLSNMVPGMVLTLKEAQAKLAELRESLPQAREDLAHLPCDYQELLNIKLGWIWRLPYQKMLEGKECSSVGTLIKAQNPT